MWPALAAFAFGLLAGFIMIRLGSKKVGAGERHVMRSLGWVLMASSLTVAVTLLGWAAIITVGR